LWGPTDIRPDWLRISFDSPRPPKVEFQKNSIIWNFASKNVFVMSIFFTCNDNIAKED
jgi:hypothetical protein